MIKDMAGKSYWDSRWESILFPASLNPYHPGPEHYVDRKFHDYFRWVFSRKETKDKKLLEIGCARSIWLPYFAKEFGFKIYGIDYSEIGCQQALQILSNEGVKGDIVCGDFFTPSESMIEEFDVVVSFGVLEHFEDTEGCLLAFSRFLKEKGVMITNIPNLMGLLGLIQRLINRNAFNAHIPLSRESILKAHQRNMLSPVSCDYFLMANFGVLNFDNLRNTFVYDFVLQTFCWLNRIIWSLEKIVPVKPNRWSSPYINCVATKRQK